MNITYPIVCQKKDGRYFIDFYINLKRYRLLTAAKIGLDLKPNNYPENLRRKQAELLAKLTYDYLNEHGFDISTTKLKSKKQNEKLHKPIKDISCLLNLLRRFDSNIHLCCLLTYGCLLRPHREIRLLKWKDFSDDLSTISISGDRVKSKRNRIVPVPKYIREILVKKGLEDNIFSGSKTPYNISYFSTLFKRFKHAFPSVEQGITIYSFRHSGAIEIFKRTGSLTKLQKAMGHSSLNVSLTYLRGLEVAELKEEDMPMV